MTNSKAKLAIIISAAIALSGCLDDNYNYGDGGNGGGNGGGGDGGGGGGDVALATDFGLNLYRADAKESEANWRQPFDMKIKDSTNGEVVVTDGMTTSGNITIEGVDFTDFGAANVTVVADATRDTTTNTASVLFSSEEPVNTVRTYHGWANGDVAHENWNKGSLSFQIQPEGTVDIGDTLTKATITLRDEAGNASSVDVTSAIVATKGAQALQQIKLPLSCFFDGTDVDHTKLETAIEFETTGPVQYKLKDVRWMANSVPENWAFQDILACENAARIESSEESILRYTVKNGETTGWATGIRANNGKLSYGQPGGWPDTEAQFAEIHYVAADGGEYKPDNKTFFPLEIAALEEFKAVDLSQYMESGALELKLFISGAGVVPEHDEWEIFFKFDGITPEGSTGRLESTSVGVIMSDVNKGATAYQISIPMKDLFTYTVDGSYSDRIRLNTLQHINKLVSSAQSTDDTEGHNFAGFKYGVADVKIVKTPSQDVIRKVYIP
ncbi:putative glycoside hydrolase [Photobacterium lutimaris]|uniref:Uncharacterized protein n=1 Tax=Photobacterium lutimaris TaxID=388278 RepID=A0A2T3IYV7_9GAMM|nr:putative glycoside hydrolase [Photobacterium lutimaris]PSU33855.1 hypothetical protein C9I99_10810 [Photobacterium lutimaris]TDR76180.1 hypothetical protein DFP78_103175 [Photobacterium lutimaris]